MSVRLVTASADIIPEKSVFGTASGLAARVYLDPEADRWLESGDPASLRELAAVLLASAAELEEAQARHAAEEVMPLDAVRQPDRRCADDSSALVDVPRPAGLAASPREAHEESS